MNTAAIRANRRRLLILTVIVLFCAAAYMLVEVDFSNPRLFAYAMKLRPQSSSSCSLPPFPSEGLHWCSSPSSTTPL